MRVGDGVETIDNTDDLKSTGRLKIYDPLFQNMRPRFPIFKGDFSRHHNAFKVTRGDVTTGVRRWFQRVMKANGPEMTLHDGRHISDRGPSRGSGRPRGRCFGGRRGGLERTAPIMKTGTIGIVCLSHLQCVLWTSERFWKWKQND